MSNGQSLNITNKYQLEYALKTIAEKFESNGRLVIELNTETPRSKKQNNALHMYLSHLAKDLNDRGFDMRKVLKPEVEIPWTTKSAKEFLWRPIQEIMTGEESTRNASTTDYPQIYDALNRHLGTKFGVSVEWPCKETQGAA